MGDGIDGTCILHRDFPSKGIAAETSHAGTNNYQPATLKSGTAHHMQVLSPLPLPLSDLQLTAVRISEQLAVRLRF